MFDITSLVLVLQIGFNEALNYRGYNNIPLIPASRLINYGQTRRLLNSNRYVPLHSRRFLTSDSEQLDSEDTSLEETNFRSQYLPYQRRNNYLKYNTRSDNDVSLETAPIGRISSDSYANSYRSALSLTNPEDTNFRRSSLRQRPPNLKQGQTRKYHRKGDNDLSLEVSFDSNSSVNHLAAARREDASYLRSLLSLIEQPNLRGDQSRKYNRKGDNDLSLEVSLVDRLDPDEDAAHTRIQPGTRPASLGDIHFQDSLPSNIEPPNYRQAGVNLERTLSERLILDDDNPNTNSLQTLQSNLESPNYRRNRKYSRISERDNRLQIPSTRDSPDAYIDTVLLASGEGKPDDIAVARPQLRHSGVTNLNKNSKKYDRRSGDDSNLELSTNDRLSPKENTSNYLLAFHELKTRLRSRNLKNGSPNVNQNNNRKNDENVDRESLLNDRLNPDDADAVNLSVLRLSSSEDGNNEPPKLRSRDEKQQDRRKDKSYLRLSVSSNDQPSSDDDAANNLSVFSFASPDDLNLESPLLRSRNPKQQNNRQNNDWNYLRLALSPNDKLSLDEDTASTLSDLLADNLDGLNLVPASLRFSDPSNQKNSRRDNDDTTLELPLNDRLSAKNEGLEFLLTETLDDNAAEDLVPYHESRSDAPPNNSENEELNNNRRDNDVFELESLLNDRKKYDVTDDDLGLTLSSNDRLDLDDDTASDLSDLHLTSPDNATLESLHLNNTLKENQTTQQDTTDTLHPEFPWNKLSPDDNKSSNLSTQRRPESRLISRDDNDPKDYELKLNYPWTNDKLRPDDKENSNVSAQRKPKSRLRSREDQDSKDYELKLDYPWTNDKLRPDDKENSNVSGQSGPKSRLRSREDKDPKDYELKLDFPWTNDELRPDNKENSNVSGQSGPKSRLKSREDKDPKDYELKLDYPWTNDKLKPDDKENSNLSAHRGPNSRSRSRENKDPKNYELKLEYPWTNNKLGPDDKDSSNVSNQREPKSRLRSREDKDLKDYELKLEYPWTNDKLSHEDKDSSNVSVQCGPNSRLKSRKNKELKDYELKLEYSWTNDKLSHEDKDISNVSAQRGPNSDSNLNENKSLRVMSIERQSLENYTDSILNFDDEPSGFITSPVDRRNHPRTQDEASRFLNHSRRVLPVLTTTVSPNATESLLNTSEDIKEVKTYNDTIIFPPH